MDYTIEYAKRNHFGETGETGRIFIYSTTPKILDTFMTNPENVSRIQKLFADYSFGRNSIDGEVFRVDFAKKTPENEYVLVDKSLDLGTGDTSDIFEVTGLQISFKAEKGELNRNTVDVNIVF